MRKGYLGLYGFIYVDDMLRVLRNYNIPVLERADYLLELVLNGNSVLVDKYGNVLVGDRDYSASPKRAWRKNKYVFLDGRYGLTSDLKLLKIPRRSRRGKHEPCIIVNGMGECKPVNGKITGALKKSLKNRFSSAPLVPHPAFTILLPYSRYESIKLGFMDEYYRFARSYGVKVYFTLIDFSNGFTMKTYSIATLLRKKNLVDIYPEAPFIIARRWRENKQWKINNVVVLSGI